jgi:hypothetical protein
VTAFQRVVKFAKVAALLSAVWTILCAALLAGSSIIHTGAVAAYRVSSVVQLLKGSSPEVFVTASVSKTEWTPGQALTSWLLELPAIVPLLLMAALLVFFYRWLVAIEKQEFGH